MSNACHKPAILLLFLAIISSSSAIAIGEDCGKDFSLLFENQYYYLHLAGRPTVLQYKYLGKVKRGEKTYHIFEFEEGKIKAEIEEGKIHGFRELETMTPEQLQQEGNNAALNQLKIIYAQIHEYARLSMIPQRVLAEEAGVQIVSNTFRNTKKVQSILKNVRDTDRYLSDAGFFIPGSSRIVITNKPLLHRSQGPSAWEVMVRNPSTGDYERVIDLRAIKGSPELIFDRSVHAHERTHSIIQHNFSASLPTRQQVFFQEALCDYVAAEVSGSTEIGKGATAKGTRPARDLRTRSSYEGDMRFPMRSYADFFNEPHHNSLSISNFLWQLRESVGAQEVQKILYPLFSDLSKYRPVYLVSPEVFIPGFQYANNPRQVMIHDFEYFLAVFVHSIMGNPKQKEMLLVVKNVMAEYGIDEKEFFSRALALEPSNLKQITPIRSEEIEMANKLAEQAKKTLQMEIAIGGGAVGAGGIATYFLTREPSSK